MNNHEAVTCLDKAIIELNQLFESCDKKFENQVWEILQTVCNAKKSLDSLTPQTENDIEISDAVSAAMLNINKIRIVGSRYSDAVFANTDDDNEDCLIIRTLIDFTSEAYRRLKVAESELFK